MVSASAYAPGRVEILGNHTDYNNGLVLAAAIDRGLTVSGSRRDDKIISLTSHERVEIPLSDLRPQTQRRWANYSLGVVREFQKLGYAISGFEAQISSNLPMDIGLSSSAALEVATAGFLMRLFGFTLPPLDLAKLCRRAENEFVDVQSGLLDQVTSIFGRADHLVYLDCQSEEIRTVPVPDDLALVVAQSEARSLARQYNQRREECAAAARALGLTSLRQMKAEQLPSLAPLLQRRTRHIFEENERVRRALNDLNSLGTLMNASHESSRVNFENSAPELDSLAARARSLPGVLGARLTGGGFGGAIVALVRQDSIEEILAGLRDASPLVCRIADGMLTAIA